MSGDCNPEEPEPLLAKLDPLDLLPLLVLVPAMLAGSAETPVEWHVMHEVFRQHVEALPRTLERLLSMPPVTCGTLPKGMPARGVYLFSENGDALYIGRSNRMRRRVRNHGSPSATYRQAAFAFKLAREATGKAKASYKPEGSRKQLMLNPAFVAAFVGAKARIAAMQVQFVEEADPVRQCLLEVYVATALQTPYNDFDNH